MIFLIRKTDYMRTDRIISLILTCAALVSCAVDRQVPPRAADADGKSVYANYDFYAEVTDAPVPQGYKPFYIILTCSVAKILAVHQTTYFRSLPGRFIGSVCETYKQRRFTASAFGAFLMVDS